MKKTLAALLMLSTAQITIAEDINTIVDKVYNRNDGKTAVAKQKLATCRYATQGNEMVCAEPPRTVVYEFVRKDYGAKEKDKKAVSIVTEPPADKGISFLQYDYENSDKDSDQWMYLSALRKVKRIVSAGKNEPKTGSFLGSELSYEDMEQHQVDNYTYKILKNDTYNGRDCWVMESIPKSHHAPKSNYSKSVMWIDKERYLIMKSDLYDKNGALFKQFQVSELKDINGIWTEMKSITSNVQTKRMSVLTLESVVYNIDVADAFLSQRTLTDMAFREGNLQNYRKFISN
jgi:hypothetical protein